MTFELRIEHVDRGTFRVGVPAAHTEHVVSIPEHMLSDAILGADPERLVRESFGFLLEREPATSILRSFSLDVIARYFPDYPTEIRDRLSAG